jgi:hypothetical protein
MAPHLDRVQVGGVEPQPKGINPHHVVLGEPGNDGFKEVRRWFIRWPPLCFSHPRFDYAIQRVGLQQVCPEEPGKDELRQAHHSAPKCGCPSLWVTTNAPPKAQPKRVHLYQVVGETWESVL